MYMKKNKRQKYSEIFALLFSFSFSLILFLFLLAIIPIDFQFRITVYLLPLFVFIVMYLFLTRKYRKRARILKKKFPDTWKTILSERVAYYSVLDEKGKNDFERKVQVFLGEKIITPIDTDMDDTVRVLIAASAIIPIFKYPDWEYDNIYEILVYPGNFNDEFETVGNDDRNIMGMVIHNSSTVLFSKQSLLYGFQNAKDKKNVGIHEFIHKIDEEDGAIDGIPALYIERNDRRRWLDIISKEQKAIREGTSDINPYALTNNAEFFAVVSEYFFENPETMKRNHPELYAMLEKVFKLDAVTLLKHAAKSMLKRPKKIGRNSPCPCGSGKKYKKCCMYKKRK